MDEIPLEAIGDELFACMRHSKPRPPLTTHYPDLTIEQAYHISAHITRRREADGEHIIGKKIGLTNEFAQSLFGADEPNYGFLTNTMQIEGDHLSLDGLIAPRIEAEIAFVLKHDIEGTNIQPQDMLHAIEYVTACFEIVDSRITDWNLKVQDMIADNALGCAFRLSGDAIDPCDIDLADVTARITKNNTALAEAKGAAVMGSPLYALTWLANKIPLKKHEIILSGSLAPLEPIARGDAFSVQIDHIGACTISFT